MKSTNVIIVAGGKGLRMGSDLPKQFIPIGGRPVLMHTLEAFYRFDMCVNIILVLPQSHEDYWKTLCVEYSFSIPHTIVYGGETRFHSVKNGLAEVSDGLTAVHDGVRPFASKQLLERCFRSAETRKAVIPVVPSTDSLRQLSSDGSSCIIDRSSICLVQTPQVFDTGFLKKSYEIEYNNAFTDDASVVEASGGRVYLVDGESTNIKITTPVDLKIGELILGLH